MSGEKDLIASIKAKVETYKVLEAAGIPSATTAHVEIGTRCNSACKIEDAKCFAISEEAVGLFYIYPYESIETAREATSGWQTYWVLFDFDGEEHGFGGWGVTPHTCRLNGLSWLAEYLEK